MTGRTQGLIRGRGLSIRIFPGCSRGSRYAKEWEEKVEYVHSIADAETNKDSEGNPLSHSRLALSLKSALVSHLVPGMQTWRLLQNAGLDESRSEQPLKTSPSNQMIIKSKTFITFQT